MTTRLVALLVVMGVALFGPRAAAETRTPTPIAVMPFKNLNQAPDLVWLEVGVAETMVSDLRRAGQSVVERNQLDLALTEIALQEIAGTEASTAVRLGRIVGAKTVVVGGFQRANKKLRITARFVNVETGEVADTAKVTGNLEDIFGLQDEIVQRLIGKKPPPRRARRRPRAPSSKAKAVEIGGASKRGSSIKSSTGAPKLPPLPRRPATPEKRLEAYRQYSLSLSTTSATAKVRFLKEAIALDPNFSYALDDLVALEDRLVGLRKADEAVRSARTKAMLARAFDETVPIEERAQAAMKVLGAHVSTFHYRALLEDAKRIYAEEWDAKGTLGELSIREYASFSMFLSLRALKYGDLALQAGEQHLKNFPGGMYTTAVDNGIESQIRERRRHAESARKLPDVLAKIETSREKDLDRAFKYSRGDDEKLQKREDQINERKDYDRCSRTFSARVLAAVGKECGAYLEKWHGVIENPQRSLLVRWQIARAFAEGGDFDRARERAQAIVEEDSAWASKMNVAMVARMWPK